MGEEPSWSLTPVYAMGMIFGGAGFLWLRKLQEQSETTERESTGAPTPTPHVQSDIDALDTDNRIGRHGQDPVKIKRKICYLLDKTAFYSTLRDLVVYALRDQKEEYQKLLPQLRQELNNNATFRRDTKVKHLVESLSSSDKKFAALQYAKKKLDRFNQRVLHYTLHSLVAVTELALKRSLTILVVKNYFKTKMKEDIKYTRIFGEVVAAVMGYQSGKQSKNLVKKLQRMEKDAMLFAGEVKCCTDQIWLSRRQRHDTNLSNLNVRDLNLDTSTLETLKEMLIRGKKYLQKIEGSVATSSGQDTTGTGETADEMLEYSRSDTGDTLSNKTILELSQQLLEKLSSVQPNNLGSELSIPGYYHQHKLAIWGSGLSVAALACAGTLVLRTHGLTLRKVLHNLFAWTETLISKRLVMPVNHAKELLELQEDDRSVGNPAKLEHSRVELSGMLKEYLHKTLPSKHDGDQRDELLARAAAGDVSIVDGQLAKQSAQPLINLSFGNLKQLLLINLESFKVDILQALSFLDNVIHENTATISLGTMLPIFACGYFLVRVVAWGAGSSVRALNAERDRVCKLLRHLERALIDDAAETSFERKKVPHKPPVLYPHAQDQMPNTIKLQLPQRFNSENSDSAEAFNFENLDSAEAFNAENLDSAETSNAGKSGSAETEKSESAETEKSESAETFNTTNSEPVETSNAEKSGWNGAFSSETLDWDSMGDAAFKSRSDSMNSDAASMVLKLGNVPLLDISLGPCEQARLGRIMFNSYQIEDKLLNDPEILVNQKLLSSWTPPMIGTSGLFVGAVAGAAIGGGDQWPIWGLSLLGLLGGSSYGIYTRYKATFDVKRFRQDLWVLSSPRIPPAQKLVWIKYIWRFYDLRDVLRDGK